MIVFLKNARLSFPDFWVPTAMQEGQTKKYGADFLISDETEVMMVDESGKKVASTMQEVELLVANATWKGKGQKMLDVLEASKKALRDGDSRLNGDGEQYEGYENLWYVTAKNKKRPTYIDRGRQPIEETNDPFYSGCYVNAKIDVYAMPDAKRKGVFASLLGVQFFMDGDSFGGGKVADADDFDEFEDDSMDDLG